jgi:hypothetical protein
MPVAAEQQEPEDDVKRGRLRQGCWHRQAEVVVEQNSRWNTECQVQECVSVSTSKG